MIAPFRQNQNNKFVREKEISGIVTWLTARLKDVSNYKFHQSRYILEVGKILIVGRIGPVSKTSYITRTQFLMRPSSIR